MGFNSEMEYGRRIFAPDYSVGSIRAAVEVLRESAGRELPVGTVYEIRGLVPRLLDVGIEKGFAWYYSPSVDQGGELYSSEVLEYDAASGVYPVGRYRA